MSIDWNDLHVRQAVLDCAFVLEGMSIPHLLQSAGRILSINAEAMGKGDPKRAVKYAAFGIALLQLSESAHEWKRTFQCSEGQSGDQTHVQEVCTPCAENHCSCSLPALPQKESRALPSADQGGGEGC